MGIESPSTYSDWYWKNSVDASLAFDEQLETVLAGQARSLISGSKMFENLPDWLRPVFTKLAEPESAGYGGVLLRFVSEAADGILGQSMNHALKDFNYKMAEWFSDERIDFPTATTLYQRKAIPDELYKARMLSQGYKDAEGSAFYLAQMPYPSIPDLILYGRYHGDPYNTKEEVWKWFDVPARDYPLWEWLNLQRLTTDQIHTLYRRGLITPAEFEYKLGEVGWSITDQSFIEQSSWSIPNAMLLVQGDLVQAKSNDEILKDISIADINPAYAQKYLDAILTKPASTDLVAYGLRQDPTLSGIETELQKIGIHPAYTAMYKELAYQIPPVADIITMAVREAFTPAIAAKFGQYEDFPEPFAEWAAKKGLTEEWSKRYWAAHWSLPSTTQGFEMLHRGLITQDELNMLLRALDVMPFWRDKLTGIAFRRLSRVDIRRMYGVGVLTEDEVYEAYLELGYNERDAKRMSDFTVKQILASQSKFTASNIITAYSKYMINRSEARSLLLDVGVKSENIEFIISTAEYKREWALTDSRITAIKNLYKKKVYTADKARSELLRLDMPAERVDVLMEQWYIDEKDKAPRYWTTAQTLSFIKAKLITPERGRSELVNIGYDTEHINVYMKEE